VTPTSKATASLSLGVPVRLLFASLVVVVGFALVVGHRRVLLEGCLLQAFEVLCAGGVAVWERWRMVATGGWVLLQLKLMTFFAPDELLRR